SFAAGAAAAGLNEAVVKDLDALVSSYSPENREALLSMSSQLVGLVATVAQDPAADAGKLETGAWVAQNGTQYNYLAHELDAFEKEASQCKAKGNCDKVQEKYRAQSVANDDALAAACTTKPTECMQTFGYLAAERLTIQKKIEALYANDDIPLELKADLHRYNMQNVAAIGRLLQTSAALDLQGQGVSPDNAAWGASLAAAMAGAMLGKAGGKGILPGGQTAAQFERNLSKLPPGERVAQIKSTAIDVAIINGMEKDNGLSKMNGRDVYKANDGRLYALDTQHGRFEVINARNGKHMGEVDFEFKQTKPADKSGSHDLKVK
ncbi:filamentous hemagglutinin, partial [Pseudomonas panipatensis]